MNNKLISVLHEEYAKFGEICSPNCPITYILPFERGFLSASNILLPLLEQALPYIESTAGASHLTDGFKKKPKNEHDILADKIKDIVYSEENNTYWIEDK